MIGGEGNDELNGGSGSDTFVFAKGWEQDTIQAQYNQSNQDMDAIVFTDVYADEVLLRYEDGQLVLRRSNSDDQIKVSGQFDEVPTIKQITFADGTTWSAQDIHLNALKGTDAADTITAIRATDEIYGGLGDDVLNGIDGNGQNRLFCEEGDDALTGSGLLDGGDGNDTLTGAGTLNGGMGQDKLTGYGTLSGGLDDDHLILDIGVNSMLPFNVAVLDGGEGNDVLDASGIAPYFAEADAATLLPTPPDLSDPYTSVFTLRGGKGNDVLYGSAAADVYEFNLGDGHDTLIERKPNEAWMNTQVSYDAIHFGADIRFGEIVFVRQGNDLVLRHQNGLDSITVKEHFNSTNKAANHFKIDEVRFADGTVLTYAQIDEKAVWQGTDASEQIMGYRDISDTILAGAGNDQIFAQAGHDVVDGQAGNDYLDGGAGNDTYLYGKNGGQDILDLSGGGPTPCILWTALRVHKWASNERVMTC